ncbi:MAG TPA: translation initiation factor IF-2 [Planctomycetota bacterium]|nr:translation initiation factor IF-2 [Planctomycetota bacterium]
MTQKKRIYDLAKEYGMSGDDLAKKLRDLGFTEVKGRMTALDDFMVLQIQGTLEAHGLIPESLKSAELAGGGLVLKKKKKKLGTLTDAESVEPTPSPAPAPEPPAAVEPVERPEPEPVAPREVDEEQAVEVRAPSEPEEIPALPDEAVEVEPLAASEQAAAAAPVDVPAEAAPRASAPAAPEPPAAAAPTAPTPAPPKRQGKVVGFIDLSKIQSAVPKKAESRRLRSKDDVAPTVMPTLSHDKKRALLRGDRGAREQLTSGQLREREAGRFLRRRSPALGPGGPGGGRPGGRGPRSPDGPTSPHAGGKVALDVPITVKKLAEVLSVKSGDVMTTAIRQLGMDMMKLHINAIIDEDTAVLLAHEFGVDLVVSKIEAAEDTLIGELKKKRTDVEEGSLVLRPPTVAFLGHVDHGKTTLIDAIRNSRLVDGESGGITQHIGAYQVTTAAGHHLTIIDTPGHAAFTAMRARGAHAVDIVVLVVAADDGPMPQTEEALAHAKAADSPIVVALTKIDKPEANPKRALEALGRLGIVPEAWGGETAVLEVSALKGTGIQELLERVFLESEVLELKCHRAGPASGIVLEAEIQQGKGIVAHLLVQDGTLMRGDVILAGEGYGKVRSMHDDRGNVVENATPSTPVEVSGLSALPGVGEMFYVVGDLSQAKEVAEERERKNRSMSLTERRAVTAESLMKSAKEAMQTINLIVRADVQGSVEVLRSALSELKHDEVEVRVLHAGVGAVTESDVLLGRSSNATVIAFHTGVNDKAREAAERDNVQIRHYEILYQVLDDVRELMEGTLAPEIVEEVTGHVEVRALFKSSKVGIIAGSHVIDGSVFRDSRVRVQRAGKVIHTGTLASLRREKEDAKEVREGFDCGVVVRDFQDVQPGDVLEAFRVIKVKRKLGDKAGV